MGPARPRALGDGPIWNKLPIVLALISFCFYLPFLKVLPFAQIRTDLGDSGSGWSACCS